MPTPLVPSDLFLAVGVADPQIAPDARHVYFRRTTLDRARDRSLGTIWRVDREGAASAFTAGPNDRLPRLSPDGKTLAFVAERDDAKARLYVMATDGGEARPLGDAYTAIAALVWSPDGTSLAFVAPTPHDEATAPIFHDETSGARHIRRLPFKSDADGLLDGVRKHLFVLDVASGKAEHITTGDFDVAAPAWSPDGKRIAFSAAIDLVEDSFASDIHVVDLATRERRTLTSGNGPMTLPSFSRDGKTIAFVGHEHGDDAGGRFNTELLLVGSNGGAVRSPWAALDRTVLDSIITDMRSGIASPAPVWSADGTILLQVSDEGSCGVRAFAPDGAVRSVVGGERDVFGFSVAPDGTIAFVFTTPTIPADVALRTPDGAEVRLTTVNDAWLSERLIVAPDRYRPRADDGTVLDAWLLVPPEKDGPLPLVLEVHGGPHAAYGHAFFFEFQMLAGLGCAVAYGNPRGGQSYGHGYANAITGDWGGIDASDVLHILDGALERANVDRARIGLAGGSYGGFMTTWLLGHSDRFAAGVSMRAVNDFVSEAGASDLGWFLEREVGAPEKMADGGRALFERSPMRSAAAIEAPLLVEHSERDFRCPIDQGEQLFTLLRRLGKREVEFVRFTGDGHELSRGGKPRNRVLRLRAIGHWFVRHLRLAETVSRDAGSLFAPIPGEGAE
jgi:dipeptidyl aminopeptidase/acylaminoacyl peptidase